MVDDAQAPRWSRLSGAGGLVLGVAFVLPAVRGCNSDIVPARELASDFAGASWFDAASMSAIYLLPYLFGLAVFLHSLARHERSRRAAGIAVASVLVMVVATAAVRAVWDVAHDQNVDTAAPLGVAAVVSCLYMARAVWRRPGTLLYLRWYGALLCVLWFGGWWCVISETRYGLWASFFASSAILAACVWEVRARTGLDTRRALARLATVAADLPPSTRRD